MTRVEDGNGSHICYEELGLKEEENHKEGNGS
jgi:hypothetical protein